MLPSGYFDELLAKLAARTWRDVGAALEACFPAGGWTDFMDLVRAIEGRGLNRVEAWNAAICLRDEGVATISPKGEKDYVFRFEREPKRPRARARLGVESATFHDGTAMTTETRAKDDPRELHPRLHIGTSSWSSEDWIGPFYPPGTKPGDFLRHYATRFDTVEVDSSFYRAPSAAMCAKWADVTPSRFTFALKVPKSITHEKAMVDCGREWETFVSAVDRLEEKLGFLVLQFGYFNKQSACPNVGEFVSRLDQFVQRFRPAKQLVVEIRNKNWLGKELLDFLHGRKLILALTDQEWMPRIRDLWEKHSMKLVTGPKVYIRWLGERKRIDAMTETWEKLVIDRTPETREWIPIVRAFLAQDLDVSVFVNNHFAGHAPASIELLAREWHATGASDARPGDGP